MLLNSQHKILIDHSLGTKQIPQLFVDAGFVVATIEQEFGSTDVPDITWIEKAGKQNWIVISKDKRIRNNQLEREAVINCKARLVCLTNANLGFRAMATIFDKHMEKLVRWFEKPGPWILAINLSGIEDITEKKAK